MAILVVMAATAVAGADSAVDPVPAARCVAVPAADVAVAAGDAADRTNFMCQ